MRELQQRRGVGELEGARAYVCGVGMLPAPLLFALADLEDACGRQRAHPDDPSAAAEVAAASEAAEEAMSAAVRAAGVAS